MPEIVLLVSVSPPLLLMPPPTPAAVLPEIVLLVTVSPPLLLMPPPAPPDAVLLVMLSPAKVRAPAFWMPESLPCWMVRFAIDAPVTPELTVKTTEAPLPSTVTRLTSDAPLPVVAPAMVVADGILSSPFARVMVVAVPKAVVSKVMLPPPVPVAAASRRASRRLHEVFVPWPGVVCGVQLEAVPMSSLLTVTM